MERKARCLVPTRGLVANDIGLRDVLPEPPTDQRRVYTGSRWSQLWASIQFAGIALIFGWLTWSVLGGIVAGYTGRWFWLILCLAGLLFCLSELGYSLWWLSRGPYRVDIDPEAGTWETAEWRGTMAEIAQVDLEGVQRGMGSFQVKVVLRTPEKQRIILGLWPDLTMAKSVARYFDRPITLKRLAVKGPMHNSR